MDIGVPKSISTAITIWLAAAVLAGASGLTSSIDPPFPQVILAFLVIAQILVYSFSSGFRTWCLSVELRALVLLHLTRFVGFYFLYLYSEGRLPYDFAVPGGWGDIATAVYAVILVLFVKPEGKTGWSLYFVWNLFGFADILFVVLTAVRLTLADPGSMSELLKLPLSLLPTFIVPIIIFIHLVIFVRLHISRKRGYGVI